jgi:predicted alpha/beta-hydrolase family hydrolase
MNVIWQSPSEAIAAVVLAHGAGAGMSHRSMQAIADAFERRGVATLRFNFPFIEAGRNRTDSQEVSTAAIAEAFQLARSRTTLPLWLGGHSFGGRMASHAVLDRALDPVGLILCSFPLHPPGKPGVTRAAHLPSLRLPLLFLSGTRDELADNQLLKDVVANLVHAQLHWLDTSDHGYRLLKRTRKNPEDVFGELARVAREFIETQSSLA